MKKVLKAVEWLMNQWKKHDDDLQAQESWSAQYARAMQNATSPAWFVNSSTTTLQAQNQQLANSYTNITTNGSTLGSTFGMGGAMGGLNPNTFTTTTPYTYVANRWELSAEQMDRLLAFLEKALQRSWTCMDCGRSYAPTTPDCEFCNIVKRLEGSEAKEAV